MKLMFIGADHEVTGSCHYLEACGKHFLIDCGMQQGIAPYEKAQLPVPADRIDFVVLTHAHIDHSGHLPLLYKNGFHGRVFATDATVDLCHIMLKDSAHIQEFEAEWKNRKAQRAGKAPVEPVYTMDDALGVLELLEPYPYDKVVDATPGIKIRFTDVGHLLGSSSIEVWINEQGVEKKIVFSGDIGNFNQPLIKDPQYTDSADIVVMESTYGDRLHKEHPDYVNELADIFQKTFDRGGNVVIPSFAVGRTQELLYYIRDIKEKRLVQGHGDFPVYMDSPLAIEATNIFNENVKETFDDDAMALVNQGINPITFSNLKIAVTSEDSRAINDDIEPKVIISASGMCEAGRIRHHLKHNLWYANASIVFVGYQAYGTLGRAIVEGASEVKLFGETIQIAAQIIRLEGLSGHGDKNGLIRWVEEFKEKPKKIFVVHGEDQVCEDFAHCLTAEHQVDAQAPFSGDVFDLVEEKWLERGSRVRTVEPKRDGFTRPGDAYSSLLETGAKLMSVIQHNQGGANKDMRQFEKQLQELCEKWDR